MKTKEEILAELQEGLKSGVLTENDLRPYLAIRREVVRAGIPEAENKTEKMSAVDVMFYIAGIVLFSTIMSIIIQSWNDGSAYVHILLSAFIGMGLWAVAYYLIGNSLQNDIRRGLTNALLLTGSLLIIVGGYIVTNEIIGGFNEVNFIPAAFALAVLGGLHIGFDRLIKRDFILLIGVLLAVASFPALIFGFLKDAGAPMDIWALVVVASSGLLAYAARIIAKLNPDRQEIDGSFDSFAAFLALMSMYVASYSDRGVLWLGVLIAAVFGIFYLSIMLQNKQLLGSGSFFLVLTIITISFKYFSGFGITVSLIIATLGLLGSAAIASGINKKYFKETVE